MSDTSQGDHHLIKVAGLTAVMSGTGAVAGLILDALILFTYGAGTETDAFLAAMTIPTVLNGIVSIQGPKILIPLFATLFDREQDAEAWFVLRNLLTAASLTFAAVSLLGVVLSGIIMPIQIPGLDARAIALAVSLSRILFLLVWCQCLASILQSVLYARHSYAISSAGKLVINTVTILVVLISGRARLGIELVAWGMVLGSLVQLLLLGLILTAHGFQYRWTFVPRDPRLRATVRDFAYPLAGHVLGESGAIIQNVLGSFLGSGSVTVLRYASRIVQAIGGILLGSVVQVTLPTMARRAAANDLCGQKRALMESFQILALVGVPLSIWLVLLAQPLVVLFFQRGHFSTADAAHTAAIIGVMVPSFLLTRFVNVSQQMFYANADLRTPFVSTLIYTIANVVFALVLVRPLGAIGIGTAVSIASICNLVYMIFKLRSSFGAVPWSDMRTFTLRLVGTTIAAGAGFILGSKLLPLVSASEIFGRVLAVAIPSCIGGGVFGLGVIVFRLFDSRLIASAPREESVPAID